MSAALPPTETQDRDEALAALLAELSDQARQGHEPDVSAAVARHPHLSAELRELWAAAQFADAFARPRSRPPAPPTLPATVVLPGSPTLPRQFGEYELLEELGRGGMGVVYKARQPKLDRTVALKMILRGEHATTQDQQRFSIEAQAAGRLQHPNIVQIYEAGEVDGQPYFSMQWVEGQTLGALMSSGPMRPREAARIMAAVSQAVHHAHERGVLHRDIKPSNVLIDAQGQPHVTDFGLAKRVSTPAGGVKAESGVTLFGAILGTPAYMAPEQVSGSRGTPSPLSDVYSLGVILYEMLTGRPPFQGATPVDTLLLVLDQDPVLPRLLNPKVDPDLELICLKCLQKQPELRYPSALELAKELERYLAGEELAVRSFHLGNINQVFSRVFRDTHHAVVLENWGVLWMTHSVKILLQCFLTTAMWWSGVRDPWWYLVLWGGGLMVWGPVFWSLRKRAGPVLFVERQVAHVWAAAVVATVGVFLIEMLHVPEPLPVLTLAPALAVIAGMVFLVKAGTLSGEFYVHAGALFLTVLPMVRFPEYGVLIFGVVAWACFFVPGLKYHLLRKRSRRARADATTV